MKNTGYLTAGVVIISAFYGCSTAPVVNSQAVVQEKPPVAVSAENTAKTAADAAGQTLMDAAGACKTEEVKKLTIEGADVNAITHDKYEVTPLMKAAEKGCYDTAKALIDAGADVKKISRYGYTSLMYAAKGGNKELVKLLIDKGVDVDQMGCMFTTALGWAANKDTVEILRKAGAK
jgi:ankyrin repeat protein